jgi:hypothetical protein
MSKSYLLIGWSSITWHERLIESMRIFLIFFIIDFLISLLSFRAKVFITNGLLLSIAMYSAVLFDLRLIHSVSSQLFRLYTSPVFLYVSDCCIHTLHAMFLNVYSYIVFWQQRPLQRWPHLPHVSLTLYLYLRSMCKLYAPCVNV